MYDDDDDNGKSKDKENQEENDPEAGKYDLGQEIGTRIGEHEEDPSL